MEAEDTPQDRLDDWRQKAEARMRELHAGKKPETDDAVNRLLHDLHRTGNNAWKCVC